MKKLTLALSVLSLSIASSLAQADTMSQDQKVSGFYVGGAVGQSKLSATDSENFNSGADFNYTDDMDTKDSSLKILAGYQFNRIVGVEASYTDYGKFGMTNGGTYSISPTALTVAANLGYTFHSGWRPFGLVGLSTIDLGEDGIYFEDDSGPALHYGVGVEFSPVNLQGLAFRATWESDLMFVEDPDSDYDDYALSLSNLSIGATYKF